MSIVYINGEYLPIEDARINVLDRGFTFGDGVYEVIPVFNRTVFRYDEHLQRLENSLAAIYMDNPMNSDAWQRIFKRLIDSMDEPNQSLYLQVTRGVSERDHAITSDQQPTVFVMSRPLVKKDFSAGINAIIHEDVRWQYCDIKAITLLPSVILRHRASIKGAREAILIRDGYVSEGAASNVFICSGGKVLTPPKGRHVLPGITRDLVIELLRDNDIECNETPIGLQQLQEADEVWITSSTWEIVPVVKLDDLPVGDGVTGPFWSRAYTIYQDFKKNCCK